MKAQTANDRCLQLIEAACVNTLHFSDEQVRKYTSEPGATACMPSVQGGYVQTVFTDVRDTTQIVPTLTEKFNAEVLKAVTQFAFTWAPALVVCYHSLGGDGLYDIVAEKSLYGGWRLAAGM